MGLGFSFSVYDQIGSMAVRSEQDSITVTLSDAGVRQTRIYLEELQFVSAR